MNIKPLEWTAKNTAAQPNRYILFLTEIIGLWG